MNQLIWTDSAKVGLADIFDPFIDGRPEFIANALMQISGLENLLIDKPRIGSPTDDDGQRKLRVGRTPIILIYRVDDEIISIVRVHHSSQDWRK